MRRQDVACSLKACNVNRLMALVLMDLEDFGRRLQAVSDDLGSSSFGINRRKTSVLAEYDVQ
jgi:hypothetical protein